MNNKIQKEIDSLNESRREIRKTLLSITDTSQQAELIRIAASLRSIVSQLEAELESQNNDL